MDDPGALDSLRDAERRLQAAQLASDVTTLDALIDDELLFTGPDGSLLTKNDDLNAHRSGSQVLRQLEELDLRVRVVGSTGVTWVHAALVGSIDGAPFASRLRYTRTWTLVSATGWKIVAAQATFAGTT